MSRIFRIHLEIENNPYSENEIVSFLYLKFYFENFCYLYLAKDKNFTYFIYRIALSCLNQITCILVACSVKSNYLYFSSVFDQIICISVAEDKITCISVALKIYLCLNIHKWRSCSSRFGLSSR
ncbi:hypothetical protein RIR_jg33202.t1 [Rhizophagus irregularis DAOM 181602=DAOM 197198]|nr:hypothetical protein RIR_jg33202.t1 [Rhizophagus irregularis DAOM 181602=DAOM 197198]